QDVVGLVDLLEARLGGLVPGIAIWVILHRELAVGLLEVIPGCLSRHTQRGVIVLLGHFSPLLLGAGAQAGLADRYAPSQGKSRPAWGEARALCGRGLWGHGRARPHRRPDSGLETPPPPLAEGEGANQDWSWGLPPPPKPLPQVEGEFLPR